MQSITGFNGNSLFADKRVLRRIIEEQSTKMGLEYDPTITPADSRRMILEDGVKPEDNLFSCGIVQAREE
ncbi:MAG: hypothetical protein H7308_09745 [Chthonomonadaceae bacterium]|nr:hypothetical protein [Chthonomonadaceae bacterium]